MESRFIDIIQQKVRQKDYIITLHAIEEAEKDDIEVREIIEALLSGIVIEDYPSDQRGHSCLIYGHLAGKDLHVCCGMRGSRVAIITVYVPDSTRWIDSRIRR